MEDMEVKKIAKNCKRRWLFIRIAVLVIFLVLYSLAATTEYGLMLAPICGLLFVYSVPIMGIIVFNKYVYSILINDLDPEKYLSVLNELYGSSQNAQYLLNGYAFTGRYQDIINICVNRLHHSELQYYFAFYLNILANCYFELNDIEKLRLVCDKFESAITTGRNNKKTKERYLNNLDFFKCYINGDLNGCKVAIEKSKTYATANSQKVYVCFKEAVVTYKAGDREKAKALFDGICSAAPKCWISELSKKYIQAIEEDKPVVISETEILPDEFYVYPYEQTNKTKRQAKTLKAIRIFFLIIFFLSIIYFCIFGG